MNICQQFSFFIKIMLGFSSFLFLNMSIAFGQIIHNQNGEAFGEFPFFNTDFIKTHQIESISGKILNYKLGSKFKETGENKSFFFNREGQLIKEVEKIKDGADFHSNIFTFQYDKNGNLTLLNKRYPTYIQTISFEYDEKNRKTKQELRENYQLPPELPLDYVLDEKYLVTTEFFTYSDYEKQEHQSVFINSGELPYKNIFTYFNADNLTAEINESFLRISHSKNTTFVYDDHQNLCVKQIKTNKSKTTTETFIFDYDEQNNLIQRIDYKDEQPLTRYEIIYKSENNFINDILIQDLSTKFIRILELRNYAFYED